MIDEPLPEREELGTMVREVASNADGLEIDDATVDAAVDALRGVAIFPAEQAVAMSIVKRDDDKLVLDVDDLWERKRQLIDSTPGLSIVRNPPVFADIGGVEEIKRYLRDIANGSESFNLVVWIDELEKAMAGAFSGNDTTSVNSDQLGMMLREMQDNEYDGIICVGSPGTCKSMVSQAVGGEVRKPVVSLDLGAARNKYVGSSEERIRAAFKTLRAMSDGRILFMATCNKEVAIPEELKRRFTLGTFYFELPDDDEKALIWPIYLRKYKLEGQPLPPCPEWTGAEIKQCCKIAYRTGRTLLEAAKSIVPAARSGAANLAALRQRANGIYLSASYPGVYVMDRDAARTAIAEPASTSRRRIR
jgi:hypothetical protein